ncbi:hypothetical protein A2U01_0080059, partial [Trifolium medium]|nr:hypothetical protein [Trifolium medium]
AEAGGALRHYTEQVGRSFWQLRAAQVGWRVAPACAKESWSFSQLRAAQVGWRVAQAVRIAVAR